MVNVLAYAVELVFNENENLSFGFSLTITLCFEWYAYCQVLLITDGMTKVATIRSLTAIENKSVKTNNLVCLC